MSGSQKFLSRNRAPRVQIEYDVELYGAQKKVQLPFVMGVMADLSGKSEVPIDPVKDRKFLEIDIDNFDQRMKALKPRAAFSVANTLSGEGNLSVDLVFEKMSDFTPAAIARKVEPLRKLLEARTQLSNLMTYMDGKAGAEELIERLVADPQQLRAIALGAGGGGEADAAFEAMKAAAPAVAEPTPDKSSDILASMAAGAPEDAPQGDAGADILAGMAASAPDETPEADTSADVLAGLAAEAPMEAPEGDAGADILAGMAAKAPMDAPEESDVDDMLASMAADAPVHETKDDAGADILAGLAESAPDEPEDENGVEDLLAGMVDAAPEDAPEGDAGADILAGMAASAPDAVEEEDSGAGILEALAESAPDQEPDEDKGADILAGMAADAPTEPPEADGLDDMLANVAAAAPAAEPEADDGADILAGIAATAPEENDDESGVGDVLASMATAAPEGDVEEDSSAGILEGLAEAAPEDGSEQDVSAGILADIAEAAAEDNPVVDAGEDILASITEATQEAVEEDDGLDDMLADMAADAPESPDEDDSGSDVLAGLRNEAGEEAPEDDGLEDLLINMVDAPAEDEDEDESDDILGALLSDDGGEAEAEDDLDGLLAEVSVGSDEDEDEDESGDILGALLGDDEDEAEVDDDLDALLADVSDAEDQDQEEGEDDDILAGLLEDDEDEEVDDGLDALLADVSDDGDEDDDALDLESLLADSGDPDADPLDDLDSLLAADDVPMADDEIDNLADLLGDDDDLDSLLEADDDGLDDLLAGDDDDDDLAGLLGDDNDDDPDLSDLMSGADELDDLDDLLGDDEVTGDDDVETTPPAKPKKPAFQPDFGSMSAAKLQDAPGSRRKFRIAVLGDFSGRGNHGDLETGAALGNRKAFKLDFDTMDDVIARFRTTLKLPLGDDGSAVEVELNELDDLHPDELFENVELFNELYMLRRDLKSGRNFDQNVARMKEWGGAFGDFRALSKKRSKGSSAPADMRLSDFQSLIGDTAPSIEASSAQDLISRIVGPHIVTVADNGSEEMIAAVDRALSTAMSSVLHHPDFQSVEAAWRSIELLGRRVESSAELEVVVYDVSVEEFSADLAAQEDLAQSGLYDMLVEKPRQDESAGPISAVIGLYTWEETPTHAELLARMARISAHMDAPFISAISSSFMGVKPEDRHPLVKKTWDALGEMPAAKYLGLATPRFMLRMPYGQKTEPLDRFDYEEFNLKEGMRSMLMANPALLVAVLLAETKAQQGGEMSLGSIMSLNDMPFHYMTDQYGDQVALPCTERLLSVAGAAEVIARRFMPVISVQGQNMVKLGSFQAVGGGELLGIWAGDAAKEMKSGAVQPRTGVGISAAAKQVGAPARPKPAADGEGEDDDLDLGLDAGDDDDFDLGGDDDLDLGGDDDLDLDFDLGDDGDDGLDDLLAGFGDDDDDEDDGDMDADLAALLGDL